MNIKFNPKNDVIAALEYEYAKGKADAKLQIAKNLLQQGMEIQLIAAATNLSLDEVRKLKEFYS